MVGLSYLAKKSSGIEFTLLLETTKPKANKTYRTAFSMHQMKDSDP